MKRTVYRFAVLAGMVMLASASAQDAATARANALADRQVLEDNTKRIDAVARDVQDLQAANQELRKSNDALRREVESLRTEMSKSSGKNDRLATKDEIRQLVEKMQEMEKNRVAEKDLILKELAEMHKLMARPTKAAPPAPVAPAHKVEAEPPGQSSEIKGRFHIIQKDEYLGRILDAYNKDFKEKGFKRKTTLDAVLKANPNLKPEAMAVGTKVFIPNPED